MRGRYELGGWGSFGADTCTYLRALGSTGRGMFQAVRVGVQGFDHCDASSHTHYITSVHIGQFHSESSGFYSASVKIMYVPSSMTW